MTLLDDDSKNWLHVTTVHSDVISEFLYCDGVLKRGLPGMYVDGDVYFLKQGFYDFDKKLNKEPIKAISKMLESGYNDFNEFLDTAKEINKIDFKQASRDKLLNNFSLYLKKLKIVASIVDHPLYLETYISNFLKASIKNITENDLALLFFSQKSTNTKKANTEFLRLALYISQNNQLKEAFMENSFDVNDFPEVANKIEAIAKEYAWLGMRFLGGVPLKTEDFMQRIGDYLAKSPEKVLKELEEKEQQYKGQVKEVLKKYNIKDRDVLKFIELAQEVSFYRTWRLERINQANYYALPLLREIASNLGIDYYDMIFLKPDEIIAALKGDKIEKDVIAERKKGFAIVVTKEKIIQVIVSEALAELKSKFALSSADSKAIKGIPACPGKADGKCVVLSGPNDFHKVKKGDIVVTKMTTPDFVPVLEKASAIVADVGGMTSHTAIISRELGIPCIIGTKTATKVFKDGDMVEVDAGKGIVKFLKTK